MAELIVTSILLGIALAMDACAVSMANGLNEPKMKMKKIILVAFMFGFFQAMMPLIGYFIGHAFISYIEKFIPWIALILLGFLGGKAIIECIIEIKKGDDDSNHEEKIKSLTFKMLIVQAIATSIDALSVGFTIADYTITNAFIAALIIAIVTFVISFVAVHIGKKFGDKLGNKAELLGGIILVAIGLEIFIKGIWF